MRRNIAKRCVPFELSGYSIYRSKQATLENTPMSDLRGITVTGLSLFAYLVSFDPAFAFLAYVSNEKGNSISVVDTDKMETVATIKTGQRRAELKSPTTVNSSS